MGTSSKIDAQDKKFMSLALKISRTNLGQTSSNPSVGSIIVKNNKIISKAVTAKTGRPHSEVIAILNSKEPVAGATIYVTLEPCFHFGQTAPCADLIIASKISRVVIATIDPDKRVKGKAIKKLKQAGIEVVVGVLEKEAIDINRGFFYNRKLNRPFVTLKLATSLDEKIFDKNSKNKWITNEKSREYSHYLRSINNAILVGSNTVRNDDPMLNCRIPGKKKSSPIRIIVSNNLDIDLDKKIIQTAQKIPTFIATANSNYKKFLSTGVQIIKCKKNSEGKIDLANLLKKLAKLGINNLLVEGGSFVATEFLENNLVDELIWMKSNFKIGNHGLPATINSNLKLFIKNQNFKITEQRNFDDDLMTIHQKTI